MDRSVLESAEESAKKFLNPGKVPVGRLQGFLTWLANLNIDDPAATEKFLRDYADFFFPNAQFRRHQEIVALTQAHEIPKPELGLGHGVYLSGELSSDQQAKARREIVARFHLPLGLTWMGVEPGMAQYVHSDERTREWFIQDIRRDFWQWLKGPSEYATPLYLVSPLHLCPPNYRFEQAMAYLQRNLHLAKQCANRFCATPFFLAPTAARIYCSDECAAPSKRAAKLKWWNENRKGKGR